MKVAVPGKSCRTAKTLGDQRAIDELSRVGPPPYESSEGYRVQRKWANAFEGADKFLDATIGFALVSPGNSVQDINDSGDGQMLSGERLWPQLNSVRPADLGLEFSIPFFVFQGEEDFFPARQEPMSLGRLRQNSDAAK